MNLAVGFLEFECLEDLMKKSLLIIICFFCFRLNAEENKVALLFLTRSDLNHTQLWKEWIDYEKYNVYNHSKTRVIDPWFAQFRITETQPNEWGFILLAQQALLKAALQDSSNSKFVFLSESCVPLRANDQVYDILTSDDSSYMCWAPIWWTDRIRDLIEFPIDHQLGNHTWIILNRKHAEMIANDNYWINIGMRHVVGDEAYPASFFSMNGVLGEFKNVLTTFVDWRRGNPFYPYHFKEATEENIKILIDARKDPHACYLFGRKFSSTFPEYVLKCIQNED